MLAELHPKEDISTALDTEFLLKGYVNF